MDDVAEPQLKDNPAFRSDEDFPADRTRECDCKLFGQMLVDAAPKLLPGMLKAREFAGLDGYRLAELYRFGDLLVEEAREVNGQGAGVRGLESLSSTVARRTDFL